MKLKITSSNIRFDNPKDGAHNWSGRRMVLADVINNFAPDLLGTQEGWQNQLYDFKGLLPKLNIADIHRKWIDDRMYPTIFHSDSNLSYFDSGDIWLSETPYIEASKSFDSAFPRLCTWTKFNIKNSNKTLLMIDVHLDHLDTSTRQEQIKVLITEINKINNCDYTILVGDFNEGPDEGVRRIITDMTQLYDPWIKLKKAEEISHHSFEGERPDGSRIDWILLSKNIDCTSIYLFKDKIGVIYPSDHYPVMAEIILSTN